MSTNLSTPPTTGAMPRLAGYIQVLTLLSISILHLPLTMLLHPLLLITSPSTFRSQWFESFWKVIGPQMAASPLQIPYIRSVMSRAKGVVLEIGPGTGDQMRHFVPSQIQTVYAAEPNRFLHAALLAKAHECGLGDGRYTVLESTAQPGQLIPALRTAGLLAHSTTTIPPEGIFDSVVAVKCMCSVPRQELAATISILQALLKPGGEFLWFEHLGNDRDLWTRTLAWLLGWIWTPCMGGCQLDGRLDAVIRGMGGWEEKKIANIDEYQGFELFRYAKGVCVKGRS